MEVVRKCVEKVETPKDQISLRVRYPESDFFSSFRKIAKYLNTFHLGGRKVINLSLFNDIPVVILDLDGVTRITNELQNIQSLYLSTSEIRAYQESYSFRGFDEEFPVSQTGNMTLKKIPFRTDFNEQFQIIYAERNNLRDLRCYFQAKDPSNFLNIVALELCGDFSFSRLDLSFIANIEHVRLYGDLEGQGGAVFPVFKGRTLLLSDFDLSLWTEEKEILSIEKLTLKHCSLGTLSNVGSGLPSMPNLRELELNDVTNLRSVRTFPKCEHLELNDLDILDDISPQPNLKKFIIEDCPRVHDCSTLDGNPFEFVSITSIYPPNYSWARNASNLSLELHDYPLNLSDLITNSTIPVDQRQFSIHVTQNVDFSLLNNWNSVSIQSVEILGKDEKRSQLHNIDVVTISQCRNYVITSNLLNIKKELIISECENLTTLVNLQNIPQVRLRRLAKLKDFSGLGNHRKVIVEAVPVLERAAEQYAKAKRTGKEKKHPNHEIFASIKTFVIFSGEGWLFRVRRELW